MQMGAPAHRFTRRGFLKATTDEYHRHGSSGSACPSCKGSMQFVGNVPCGENLPSTFECRCGVTVAIEQALEEQPTL